MVVFPFVPVTPTKRVRSDGFPQKVVATTPAGSALVAAFRRAKRDPSALVFASAVIAYMAQATVNISLPIATPLFIIFVALCACPGDTVGAAPRTGEKPTELPRGSKEKK